MKKYETPQLEEKKVEIEDIIASSNLSSPFFDSEDDWLGDNITNPFR